MLPLSSLLSVGFILSTFLICKWRRSRHIASVPLPPGPPAWPIIGNILPLRHRGRWELLDRYRQQYGDLVYLHGFGNHILSVNAMEGIDDLMGKRGSIYSHRPVFTVVGELMGLGQSTPLLSYGPEWKLHRRFDHMVLNATAVKKYHPLQEDLSVLLCSDLLSDPDNFFAHNRLFATRVVITVTYGLTVKTADDEYVTHAHSTMNVVSRSTIPGAYICDFLPFLKHLPRWVPFRRDATKGKEMIEHLVTKPYEHVKRNIISGTATPSLARDLLETAAEEKVSIPDFDYHAKWATGSMYGAGGEATYATILTFIAAMALHPDKQTKAQEEIEKVVGFGRLPHVSDAPDLPYVNAIIKETMRWHPLLPLTLARRTTQDDIYKGYFIPKGCLVIPNVWATAFAENKKYAPTAFIPERFLDQTQNIVDPSSWAFGFGRRVCPGRYLAENSVFIAISTILWTFTIRPPSEGLSMPEFEEHLISYPMPFPCRIEPRSSMRASVIRNRAAECYA